MGDDTKTKDTEAVIAGILDDNEQNDEEQDFLEHLHELDHKVKFAIQKSTAGYASSRDVIVMLKKLTIKAASKVRDFLMGKIAAMRKPLANYQVPQNILLKNRFYMEFLMTHDRYTATEIKNDYCDTTSKIYFSYFKAYVTKLSKIQLDVFGGSDDLLGKKLEDVLGQNTSSVMSSASVKTQTAVRSVGLFSLGDRLKNVLSEGKIDAPVIIPHATLKNEEKFPYEVIFRSIQFALFDSACREYLFLSDFFAACESTNFSASVLDSPISQVGGGECSFGGPLELFDLVLGKTVVWLHRQTETQIAHVHNDVLGLLLCLQIVHRLQFLGSERIIPVLDNYWKSLLKTLWSKCTERMEAHCSSLATVDVSAFTSACAGLLPNSTMRSSNDASDVASRIREATAVTLPPRSLGLVRPHPLARRFAELAASLYAVGSVSPLSDEFKEYVEASKGKASGEGSGGPVDVRVLRVLNKMQMNFEEAINRLADALPRKRLRLVFLLNNYELIISVLSEHGASGSVELAHCREVVAKHSAAFTEQALLPYFGAMVMFVAEHRHLLHEQQTSSTSTDTSSSGSGNSSTSSVESRVTHIVRGFNIDWRNSIDKIHEEIRNEFANFTIATHMFKMLLSQLIQLYRDFQRTMTLPQYRQMPVLNQLVSVHEILNEIKKLNMLY